MKALRLKLYQNLVNYRQEMSYGYVQTYPLPTPSMVKGMAHKLLDLHEYKNLKISIQGDYSSIVTNLQKIYKFDTARKEYVCPVCNKNHKDSRKKAVACHNREDVVIIEDSRQKIGNSDALNTGVQYVDLIANMNLLLHIAFDDEDLTGKLHEMVKQKTVILGRNEDIARVDFLDTFITDIKESTAERNLKNNIYLTPKLCHLENLSGTHYRLPFYYANVSSLADKRIFTYVDAVYIAKNAHIEEATYLIDDRDDIVSFLEITQ